MQHSTWVCRQVPDSERQDAFVLGEGGSARFVGLAVGLSVAVSGYRSISLVCDGKMNEFLMGFLLIVSLKDFVA